MESPELTRRDERLVALRSRRLVPTNGLVVTELSKFIDWPETGFREAVAPCRPNALRLALTGCSSDGICFLLRGHLGHHFFGVAAFLGVGIHGGSDVVVDGPGLDRMVHVTGAVLGRCRQLCVRAS